MFDLESRGIIAQKLIPEIYNNPELAQDDEQYHNFSVSWDIPRIGSDFDFDRPFSPSEIENPDELAGNAVQLLFLDNSLLYSSESRKLLGLPENENEFLAQIDKMLHRLVEYDKALSAHPVASLTNYPEDPLSQQMLAMGALTRRAINRLKFKIPYDSDYFPHDLKVNKVFGNMNAVLSPIIPFIVRSQCAKYEPMITPEQADRVLAVLTELVETDKDRTLLDKRKILNLNRAQERVVNIGDISIDDIFELHRMVLDGIQDRTGRFRSGVVLAGGDIRKKQPCEADQVAERLSSLLNLANEITLRGDTQLYYEIIARYAAEFQLIHPFQDGNGRVGHLFTNFMLKRLNLPMFTVPMEHFKEYQNAMDIAIGNEDYTDLINVMKKFQST